MNVMFNEQPSGQLPPGAFNEFPYLPCSQATSRFLSDLYIPGQYSGLAVSPMRRPGGLEGTHRIGTPDQSFRLPLDVGHERC